MRLTAELRDGPPHAFAALWARATLAALATRRARACLLRRLLRRVGTRRIGLGLVGWRRRSGPLGPRRLPLLIEPDRHLDLGLPPVAQHRHAHPLADRRRGDRALQIARPLERGAVELDDDVVRTHASTLGGLARHDVADQHATR